HEEGAERDHDLDDPAEDSAPRPAQGSAGDEGDDEADGTGDDPPPARDTFRERAETEDHEAREEDDDRLKAEYHRADLLRQGAVAARFRRGLFGGVLRHRFHPSARARAIASPPSTMDPAITIARLSPSAAH